MGRKGEFDLYERRWVLGEALDLEGDVMKSPGLSKVIEHYEMMKERPKLFLNKGSRKGSVFAKKNAATLMAQYEDISHIIGDPDQIDAKKLQKLKKDREKKMKLLQRFNDMAKPPEIREKVDIGSLLDEVNAIASGNKKVLGRNSQRLENIKSKDSVHPPIIENPYILPEDIEYEFENVYDDFLEDIKTKQNALESIKLKYRKQVQKKEEEEAFQQRVIKSNKRVRKDSKGKEKLRRSVVRESLSLE